jgi:hypothetical protein
MATDIASRLTTKIASRPRLITEDALKYLLEQYGIPGALAADIASRLTTEIASRPRLKTEDAIKYLLEQYGIQVAKSTMKTWAWRGGGPGFQKSGQRRLYPIEQLDAWAKQRLTPVVSSTSELSAAGLLTVGGDAVREPVQEPARAVGVGSARGTAQAGTYAFNPPAPAALSGDVPGS